MKRIVTALAAGAFFVSPLAFADEAKFTAADADADGMLTSEEAMAGMEGTTEEAFTAADTDGDGSLSMEEYNAAVEAGTMS